MGLGLLLDLLLLFEEVGGRLLLLLRLQGVLLLLVLWMLPRRGLTGGVLQVRRMQLLRSPLLLRWSGLGLGRGVHGLLLLLLWLLHALLLLLCAFSLSRYLLERVLLIDVGIDGDVRGLLVLLLL